MLEERTARKLPSGQKNKRLGGRGNRIMQSREEC